MLYCYCFTLVTSRAFKFQTSPSSSSLLFSASNYKFCFDTARTIVGSSISDGVQNSVEDNKRTNYSGVWLEETLDNGIRSGILRLDNWISSRITKISRARVQSSIKAGIVHVNGRVVDKVSFNVKAGDEINCTITELQQLRAVPENIPLYIVYEDEHVIFINKPAHMHLENTSGTLVNSILHHCNLPDFEFSNQEALPDTEGSEDAFNSFDSNASSCEGLDSRLSVASIRPGIVHTLEHDSSYVLSRGCMLLTAGVPTPIAGRVEVPVGRDPNNRLHMTVVVRPVNSMKARHAASRYRVIEILAGGSCALVEWKLETGHTHQIRAHAKFLGVPLLGDERSMERRRARSYHCLSPEHPPFCRAKFHQWFLG